MPAKYHHILIAASGPQLEILSVGISVMKLKIVMAHLWKGALKRKTIRESLWRTREAHANTEENQLFIALQNTVRTSTCFHCQTGTETGPWENILQLCCKTNPHVWWTPHLVFASSYPPQPRQIPVRSLTETPSVQWQAYIRSYTFVLRLTPPAFRCVLHRSLNQQECHHRGGPHSLWSLATCFHECSFQLDHCLNHTLTHSHRKNNLPPVLRTFEEHYHWKTRRVTPHSVTPDKLPFQLQITPEQMMLKAQLMKTSDLEDLRFQDMFRWGLLVSKGRVISQTGNSWWRLMWQTVP